MCVCVGRVDDFVPDMTAKKPKLDPASLGMMFPVMPGMGPMMGAARMPVPGMMMPGACSVCVCVYQTINMDPPPPPKKKQQTKKLGYEI